MSSCPIESVEGKRAFIKNFIKSVEEELLKEVPKMPAEWDGIELREYISDAFTANRYKLFKDSRNRKRNYLNTKIVENLRY